jgi:hypothetical protein
MCKIYYWRGLILDLLAVSPFFAILGGIGIKDPIWVVLPFKLLRLIAVGRIKSILYKFQFLVIKYTQYLGFVKTILFLVYLWHWASCTWFYVNIQEGPDTSTWVDFHNLGGEPLARQYLFSIYFTMNVVTSVGYGDMYGTTDTERLITCLIIITGDALFAVAFGMMANLAASADSELDNYLSKIATALGFLSDYKVPSTIIKRTRNYYAY